MLFLLYMVLFTDFNNEKNSVEIILNFQWIPNLWGF